MITPLIHDQNEGGNNEEDPENFAEEQGLVGRLVQYFKSEIPDEQCMILSAARKNLSAGGSKRVRYTLPPIIF